MSIRVPDGLIEGIELDGEVVVADETGRAIVTLECRVLRLTDEITGCLLATTSLFDRD